MPSLETTLFPTIHPLNFSCYPASISISDSDQTSKVWQYILGALVVHGNRFSGILDSVEGDNMARER